DLIEAHEIAGVKTALGADRTLARSTDAAGSTALMYGAYTGTVGIMELLLDAGADVQAKNRRNATARHWAISDPEKMKLLLLKGACVNAKAVDGRPALHPASMPPA